MKKDLITTYSRRYKTPYQVQKLLSTFQYNKSSTLASAEVVLNRKSAHCLEGVFVAAALLEHHGYDPLVLSLESQDRLDHCLYLFQEKGLWGSIGKSRDEGLGGREPIYKTIKDLAWSYFDPYVDGTGRVTAWQIAHLDECGADWRRSHRNVWKLENHLLDIWHYPVNGSERRYQKLLQIFERGEVLPKQPHWWW